MPQQFISVIECVHRLSEFCLKTKFPYSAKDLLNLKRIFIFLSSCDSYYQLKDWFKLQDGKIIPLECLWLLHSYNLLHFTTYIYYNTNLIPQLSECFEERIWCQDENLRHDYAETVAELLSVLVNLGAHSSRDICQPGQQLLASIAEKFVDRLLGEPLVAEDPVPFLSQLTQVSALAQSRLQLFFRSLLRLMVQFSPEAISFEDAVQDQARLYTTTKTNPDIIQVLNEVLSKLSFGDAVSELSGIVLSQEQFNWRWLLTAISVLAASSIPGVENFKGVTEGWVSQACANKNSDLLSLALLCARQCCAENHQRFGSYSTWFGNLQLKSTAAFTFFFEYLAQLVPYEPVLHLKIHVNKVPQAPPSCHGVVADYAVLAKTRLADLKQTTDYVGLFGEYTTTEQEGREADVEKVIMSFKQTKEVMKVVLEASVFRRQFYEKVFLAELLKDNNPDHVEFIEKLYSIGKVPHGLYNKWRQLFC